MLVGLDGEPVISDIEGLMYTDIEVEHCWMRMRLGWRYEAARRRASPALSAMRSTVPMPDGDRSRRRPGGQRSMNGVMQNR
jgi:hypothetical protein